MSNLEYDNKLCKYSNNKYKNHGSFNNSCTCPIKDLHK